MTETSTKSRDWPTLLGDNARTGRQGKRQTHSPERVLWQFRAGAVRSAPVLDNGLLYVAPINGVLHAIDVTLGTSRWKFEVAGQVHSTPALFGDAILFGCDDGKVYALANRERNCGKRLLEPKSGHRRSFAMELFFSAVPTVVFTQSMLKPGTQDGPATLAAEFIPHPLPLNINFT